MGTRLVDTASVTNGPSRAITHHSDVADREPALVNPKPSNPP